MSSRTTCQLVCCTAASCCSVWKFWCCSHCPAPLKLLSVLHVSKQLYLPTETPVIASNRKFILPLRTIWKVTQAYIPLAVHKETTTRLAFFSKQFISLYGLKSSLPGFSFFYARNVASRILVKGNRFES